MRRRIGLGLGRWRARAFVRSDRTDAEGLGAITEEDQWIGSDVGKLVIFLRGQEDQIVFLEDPFIPLKPLHRTLAADDEKSFRRLVKVHRRAVARLEIKHPRAKIIRAEKSNVSEVLFACFIDFFALVYV